MIHLFGDSLSSGSIGISLGDALKWELQVDIQAHAVDGDTLRGVTKRAIRYVKSHPVESLIIECGSNDLLLPFFMESGDSGQREFAERMVHESRKPVDDLEQYITVLTEAVGALRSSVDHIAITSIPPLGEDTESPLQTKRRAFNDGIAASLNQLGVSFIDISSPIELLLEDRERGDSYLFDSMENFSRDARFVQGSEQRAQELSAKRGLIATIDGVHLNGSGARAAASAFKTFVSRTI
jgi:lysophospholipase L1-like esterase